MVSAWYALKDTPPASTHSFQSLEEAAMGARQLAQRFRDAQAARLGLHELMVNAVEHGNLGLTHMEKSLLLAEGLWEAEIRRRLRDPAYAGRTARAMLYESGGCVRVVITDDGGGFDWRPFTDPTPDRAMSRLHGRGIRCALALGFARVEYIAPGNTVMCTQE